MIYHDNNKRFITLKCFIKYPFCFNLNIINFIISMHAMIFLFYINYKFLIIFLTYMLVFYYYFCVKIMFAINYAFTCLY